MKDLKPCPFCGEVPIISYCDGEVLIRCENVHCIYVSTEWCANEQQAIAAWNRRANELDQR